VEESVYGVKKMVQQQQTDEFLMVLRVIFVAAPLLFIAVAVVHAVRYLLTPTIHSDPRDLRVKRRKGGTLTEEEQQRFSEYHRVLVTGNRKRHDTE